MAKEGVYYKKRERPRRKALKIRECAIESPEGKCEQYDRPINCATETVRYPSGAKRCPEFKQADIEILNSFSAVDGSKFMLTWNADKRKYIIYKNNVIYKEYGMSAQGVAYDAYWMLHDELGG